MTTITISATITSNIIKGGVSAQPPVNTIAPVVSGSTSIGSVLSCTTGTWTGTAPITYAYQWVRGVSDIIGATSSTYTLVEADAGESVLCQVTATNIAGSSSVSSNALAIPLLLDIYPNAAVAYSVRKLRTAYSGSALRVRRSSDNAETDIGFVSNQLDTASLLSFVGAGNGFVTTWYDQSGNGTNATQTTAAIQPQIVSSGSLILQNGKVAISYNLKRLDAIFNYTINSQSNFVTSYIDSSTPSSGRVLTQLIANSDVGANTYIQLARIGVSNSIGSYVGSFQASINTSFNQYYLLNSIHSGTQITNTINNSTSNTGNHNLNFTFNRLCVGSNLNSNEGFIGNIQEVIVYNNINQTSNRTAINTNINSYYSVWSSGPTWDGSQSGMLNTYSGAAVAYSVRALNSAYTGPLIRVRRSSDNTEIDIFALYNGELDTTFLLNFVGAGNGFVTTWYDQSGNGRNATQTTAANQPQIVSSGSLLQINSKPALTFDGTNDSLASSFGSTISQPISIFNTVTYPTYNPTINKYIFDSASSPRTAFIQSTLNRLQLFSGVVLEVPNTYIFNQGSQYLFSTLSNSTSSNISVNGNVEVTGNSGTSGINALTLARRFSNTEYADVKYQELVLYPSNQTTNKSLIETNINSYFNIYP